MGIERRKLAASLFLTGEGIEIGALHNPLIINDIKTKIVDRLSTEELKINYKNNFEKNKYDLTKIINVDIVDNGQTLQKIQDETQDYVIANHVVEHFDNPIEGIFNMLRVLKKNGMLFLSLPDMRFTFDQERTLSTNDHMIKDYKNKTIDNTKHYIEWITYIDKISDEEQLKQRVNLMLQNHQNIHFHTWTYQSFLKFLICLQEELNFSFELEILLRNGIENICILRKI